MKTYAKVTLALCLGLMGIVGLLMTLCGGFFTIVTVGQQYSNLVFPVLSLLVGLALIWGSIKLASKLSPGGGAVPPKSLKNTSDDQTGSPP